MLRTPRRVVRTRNPLHSFHVCPLLLHEKLCDGGGRPVHKFVFACPGTAAALVSHTAVDHVFVYIAAMFALDVLAEGHDTIAGR